MWNAGSISIRNVLVWYKWIVDGTYCHTYDLPPDVMSFPGMANSELDKFEQLFKVNTNVYTVHPGPADDLPGECELIRRSLELYDDTMNVNMYKNHVGYITDLKLYSKSYMCSNCKKMWKSSWSMKRHAQTCKDKFRHVYKVGCTH